MATKKKTTAKKPTPKTASNSNAAPKGEPKAASKPNPRGRKLGERVEKIRERLSLGQIEEERKKVCDMWRQRAELDDKRKSSAAGFKAQLTETEKLLKQSIGNAQSGFRDLEIVIEEWLTPQNQVQRYRSDTGELIGDRSPRTEDLQESLPLDPAEDEGEEEETDEEEEKELSEQVAEVAKDMAEAGEFGE